MFPEGRALEFLIVAVVALIFVGPKDLPALLRKLGQFTAKVRGMAAEFRASFDEMARQSELDDLRKEVEAMRKSHLAEMAMSAHADAASALSDINSGLSAGPYAAAHAAAPAYAEPQAPPAVEAPPRRKPRAPKAASAHAPAKPAAKPKAASRTAKAPAKAAAKPRARKPTGSAS